MGAYRSASRARRKSRREIAAIVSGRNHPATSCRPTAGSCASRIACGPRKLRHGCDPSRAFLTAHAAQQRPATPTYRARCSTCWRAPMRAKPCSTRSWTARRPTGGGSYSVTPTMAGVCARFAIRGIHEGPLPQGGEGMRVPASERWGSLAHKAAEQVVGRREETPLQPPAPYSRGARKCAPHQFASAAWA